jgi:hypothetical protein
MSYDHSVVCVWGGVANIKDTVMALANLVCFRLNYVTGTLVHWYTGTLVHWYTGTLVHWYTGTLVHWYTGTLVH